VASDLDVGGFSGSWVSVFLPLHICNDYCKIVCPRVPLEKVSSVEVPKEYRLKRSTVSSYLCFIELTQFTALIAFSV
jgi:hypothetical protein